MLKIELTLEDGHLSAERDLDVEGKWSVKLLDMPTNTRANAIWTDEQIGAVVCLALGGDSGEPQIAELYKIAEPCFKNVPIECRLIP